jgi:valyl-tRNA synthetase
LIDSGARSLRFTLVTSGTPETTRTSTRAWVRQIREQNSDDPLRDQQPDGDIPRGAAPGELDLPSRWWSRLKRLTASVQRLFDAYQYGEAGRQIRSFMWDEFADWYIEISKLRFIRRRQAKEKAQRTVHVGNVFAAVAPVHAVRDGGIVAAYPARARR